MEECIERNSFNQSEVFNNIFLGFKRKMSVLGRQDLIVEGFASILRQAKYYTLNFGGRLTSNYDKDQIFIELPYTTNYEIFIHDPTFFTLNFIPVAIPKVYRGILVNETKNYAYPMVMTEVQELDLPQDPCNMDKQYNFQVIHGCKLEYLAVLLSQRVFSDLRKQGYNMETVLSTQMGRTTK